MLVSVADGSEFINFINKVVSINLSNLSKKIIYETSFYSNSGINALRANEEWAVWVDSDSFGKNPKIIAMNLKNEDTTVISELDTDYVTLYSPQLYQHLVSGIDFKNGVPEVVIFNLESNEYKVIAKLNEFALYNNFVHMSQNYLLWTTSIALN